MSHRYALSYVPANLHPYIHIPSHAHTSTHTYIRSHPTHPYIQPLNPPYTPTPYTPTPLHPYTPTPTPLHPYTPTPLHPYTPTPLHPYTPTPLHPYTPTHPLRRAHLLTHLHTRTLLQYKQHTYQDWLYTQAVKLHTRILP